MKTTVTRRERNRHLAVALLSILLLWMILGQGPETREPAPIQEHDCWGLLAVEGEVNTPGVFLLKGRRENETCSLSLQRVLDAAGGLRDFKGRAPASLSGERQVLLGQTLTVQRLEPGNFSFQPSPLEGTLKLVWGEKLNVNTATREALSLVPRMKPEHADFIVMRRERRPWKHLGELKEIRGVGPRTVELWHKYLVAEDVE